jgi:hypothetical protein
MGTGTTMGPEPVTFQQGGHQGGQFGFRVDRWTVENLEYLSNKKSSDESVIRLNSLST